MSSTSTKLAGGLVAAASLVFGANATEIDVTSGTYTFDEGVIFTAVNPNGSGTGNWDSFDRIKSERDFVRGVNTGLNNIYNNQNGQRWTHDLKVGAVGTAGDYYLFQLDTAQSGQAPISLDRLKIFQNPTTFTSGSALTGFIETSGTPVFDTGGTDTFKVSANSGNGSGDLWMYVPKSLLDAGQYLYLYTELGKPPGNWPANGSFEEWGALKGTAPPPNVPDSGMTIALLGMSVGGIGALRRKLRS